MTKKSRTTPSEETWRECPGITDSGRLFVSSAGNVKFQPSIHHDGQTGRPYVLIDGRPVFLDSLVLSMFGDGGRPRRCYDISHADGSPDNCSVSNLEWTSSRLRTGGALSDSTPVNVSYLMQRTVTPEMVQDR